MCIRDRDGNPTTENKAEHQDTVEQYAEELLAAAGDLDAVYNLSLIHI